MLELTSIFFNTFHRYGIAGWTAGAAGCTTRAAVATAVDRWWIKVFVSGCGGSDGGGWVFK